MIARLEEAGIVDLVIVSGHAEEALRAHLAQSTSSAAQRAKLVQNPRYHDWGNFYSLLVAEEAIGGQSFIKLDADVLLDEKILPRLTRAEGPLVLAIDKSRPVSAEDMKARVDEGGRVVELNKQIPVETALGESIGVDRIDAAFSKSLFAQLRGLIESGETDEYYERAYEKMMQTTPFGWVDISDSHWCEIDCEADLVRAETILAEQAF